MSPTDASAPSVRRNTPGWNARILMILAGCGLIYLLLLLAHAATREPQPDEAMFANPAWTLATKGHMGTTVFEEAGWHFQGVNKRTYYMFPLYPFVLAGVYKITGFGLWPLRAVSIISAFVLFWLLYKLLRAIGIDRGISMLAVVVTAVDYHIQVAASFGRYDVLIAALGFGGYVAYLTLEKRNLSLALLVANTLIACGGMMHPNGLMYFIGLWTMVAIDGWRRLRPAPLAAAAAPYIIGALCWGMYIMRDPSAFRQQISANSYKRVAITQPFAAVRAEITERYMPAFGLVGEHSAGHSGPVQLKVIPLLFYFSGIAVVVGVPALRKQRGVSRLLLLTSVHLLYLVFFEGIKFPYYLVHIIPWYCSILAVAGMWLWRLRTNLMWRGILAGTLIMLALLQVGGVLLRVRLNTYDTTYAPAAAFLRQRSGPADLIMGTCDLGFALGFGPNLVDDVHFGYESGTRPRFIVIEETYRMNLQSWKNSARPIERAVYQTTIDRLQREYRLIYDYATYQIFERRPGVSPATPARS